MIRKVPITWKTYAYFGDILCSIFREIVLFHEIRKFPIQQEISSDAEPIRWSFFQIESVSLTTTTMFRNKRLPIRKCPNIPSGSSPLSIFESTTSPLQIAACPLNGRPSVPINFRV